MIPRRKPLTRHVPLVSHTGLSPGSKGLQSSGPIKAKRRAPADAEKLGKDLVRARSDGWCEIRTVGCDGRQTDWHHRKNRSQGGDWSAANGLAACRSCHMAVTSPAGSWRAACLIAGWIVLRDDDPTSMPALIQGHFVHLTPDGQYAVHSGQESA